MTTARILLVGLSLSLATALLSAPRLGADEGFKPSEHDSLGKALANYVKARGELKEVDKAREAVAKEMGKIKERLKRDPLTMPGELGRALWSSFEYEKQSKVKKGKVDSVDAPAYFDEKAKLGFAVWTPAKYNAKQAYPLILCIPGKGEKPAEHITEKWIDATIRDNAIIAAVPMPADEKAWNEISDPSKETGVGNVLRVFGQISRVYSIDFDRVYLAGRGIGVESALLFGTRFMDRFAGIIGRSGDAPEALQAENLRNLPIFLAGAGAHATALEEQLKKLGYAGLTRKDDAGESDIWSWIQSHPRTSCPPEVVFHPSFPSVTRAYWIEAVPTDATGQVYIKAKVDRAANTITVEGEGITKFFLYLNDALVDMAKPIKVVCNGTDMPLSTVPPSLLSTLEFMYLGKSDPGKVFTANRQYDLPPKPKPK